MSQKKKIYFKINYLAKIKDMMTFISINSDKEKLYF